MRHAKEVPIEIIREKNDSKRILKSVFFFTTIATGMFVMHGSAV